MDAQRLLEEFFSKFPGIGPRQARRFVYHILTRTDAGISEFTRLIGEIRRNSHECRECHRIYLDKKSEADGACSICGDTNRDHTKLMVVSRDGDFESIEKSSAYNGLYFILGGVIPILDREPEKRVRLRQLTDRIRQSRELNEVILSLNTTPDGENTEHIVAQKIREAVSDKIKVTVLGRGLSTGAELEYADVETIKSALANRKASD